MDVMHGVSLDFRHGTHLSFIRSINAGARMTSPVTRVGKLDWSRDAGPPIVFGALKGALCRQSKTAMTVSA
jgi:hypothetical protein